MTANAKAPHIVMLLENNPYPHDTRPKREAAALVSAGYRVSVVSQQPEDSRVWHEVLDGVDSYYIPRPPDGQGVVGYIAEYAYATAAISAVALWVWLRRGLDVAHVHNPPDTFFALGWFFRAIGKKFVFDHHDLAPEMYSARSENGTGRKDGKPANPVLLGILKFCERMTARAANLVITTNASYKKIDAERGGVTPEKIHIVRNGPDLRKFNPVAPDPAIRDRAGFLLAYVGIMGPQDGVDYLVRALAHLKHELGVADFCCAIVGDGSAVPNLKTLAAELDVDKHLVFTGRVGQPDVIRVLSSVDVCVVPDPMTPYNNLSTVIKIMEYMAISKPIVAFDLAEHRVSAGDAALYAEPNNEAAFAEALDTLRQNPELRASMGRIGRARVEQSLGWPHQAEALIAAYRTLGLSPRPTT
jgi:glycosyltransferase involved in cell wall biosynthesis